jgi:hypothetical protein
VRFTNRNKDFRLHAQNGSASRCRPRLGAARLALERSSRRVGRFGGYGAVANNPRPRRRVAPPFDVPFIYVPACREILDQAERRQLEPLRGKFDLVVCWHSTCRFSTFSRRLGLPADKRLSIVHNGVHRCGAHLRAKSCVKLVGASAVTCSGSLMSSGSSEPDIVWVYDRHAVDDVTRLGADVEGQNWRGRRCGTAKTTSSRYGNQPSSPNLATRLPLCCRSAPRVETHAK